LKERKNSAEHYLPRDPRTTTIPLLLLVTSENLRAPRIVTCFRPRSEEATSEQKQGGIADDAGGTLDRAGAAGEETVKAEEAITGRRGSSRSEARAAYCYCTEEIRRWYRLRLRDHQLEGMRAGDVDGDGLGVSVTNWVGLALPVFECMFSLLSET
jgi:hypothetical protein